MNRNQQILAAVLVFQLALSAVVLWPRAGTFESEPLLPGLQTADAVAMTITDNEGKHITLRQVSGNWVLPEADDYPAQAERITPVLDKLVSLTTQRLVTRTEASLKQLNLAADNFSRRIDVEKADGTRYTLYIGSSPSYGSSHVRVEGHNEAYIAPNLTAWELSTGATSWVDSSYLYVPQDEVKRVTLANAQGTFTFTRDEQGNWNWLELPAGEELAQETVNTLVTRATSVILLRPLGKQKLTEYGLDNPAATVTLLKEDEQTVTLLVGAHDEADSSYVVHASTSLYYVRVNQYNVQALVQNGPADWIKPPATPEPTPTEQ